MVERSFFVDSIVRADNEFKVLTGATRVAVHLLLTWAEALLAAVHGRWIRARSRSLLTAFRASRVAFRPRRPGRPATVN